MTDWLPNASARSTPSALSLSRPVSFKNVALKKLREAGAKRALLKTAGRIADVSLEAATLAKSIQEYNQGRVSRRKFHHALSRQAGAGTGGVAGAALGAKIGTGVGAAIGAEFAVVGAVPGALVGGIVGSYIGGLVGGVAGATLAEYGVTAWYSAIDASVRNKFELKWLGQDQ